LKLPNHEGAVVPKSKITEYLLCPDHPVGAYKAAFFRGFGFAPERWEELASALKDHAGKHDVASTRDSDWGRSYAVSGPLKCPDGREPSVKSVWFVKRCETVPILATAFPE
jgi:Domain of unknown function (DUF6883)